MSSSPAARVSQRCAQSGGSAEAWAALRALAEQASVNLGQGFPDFVALPRAVEAAREALLEPQLNQYAPMGGAPRLKAALGRLYGDEFDPDTEITVTTSGTEAVYACMQAIVNPGDRVVVFEPAFPWYVPAIKMAGGVPVTIELIAPEFSVLAPTTRAALETIFAASPPPKAIVVCSPQNPTGHCCSREELEFLSALTSGAGTVCIADEVYEGCRFGGAPHLCAVDVAGMRDRTVTIGSASKLLGMTGWRVGWVRGPADLVKAVRSVAGYTSFSAPTPLQQACAVVIEEALENGDRSFGGGGVLFEANWQALATALETHVPSTRACPSDGGYFLTLDISNQPLDDMQFVTKLVEDCGIAALPMRLFYSDSSVPRKLVRFAICKRAETIQATVAALAQWDRST